jgi:signal transduction histidine kinase
VKFFSSNSFKLAFLYLLIFSASVFLLISYFYQSTLGFLETETDTTIEIEIQGLAEQYQKRGLNELVDIIQQRLKRGPLTQSIYLFTDPEKKIIVGNLSAWPANATLENGWLNFSLQTLAPNVESHQVRAKQFRLVGNYYLIVGRDIHELAETKQLMFDALLWGLSLTLILGLLGGYILTRKILSKVSLLDDSCRTIIGGQLSQRVPRDFSNDEFDSLAETMNQMLDKIHQLMLGITQVTDNIAHDLRTPLSRLKQSLDSALDNKINTDKRQQLIATSIEEADNLINTFNALLNIAYVENTDKQIALTKVDLTLILQDLYELYYPLAENKNQQLKLNIQENISFIISAEHNLLFQALTNIIDNALKFSPKNGIINIQLSQQQDQFILIISDNGCGIPDKDMDRVFNRFFRADSSRTSPGTGLGLSLVAAVCNRLNIQLSLESLNPGLKVKLVFHAYSD